GFRFPTLFSSLLPYRRASFLLVINLFPFYLRSSHLYAFSKPFFGFTLPNHSFAESFVFLIYFSSESRPFWNKFAPFPIPNNPAFLSVFVTSFKCAHFFS